MVLDYNEEELLSLLMDFHTLTGMRIVLFDGNYRELISWPQHHCAFCARMKAAPETSRLCDDSDRTSFQECQKKGRLIVYQCHAGLIEATAPLFDHDTVIGYMMFGQISDKSTQEEVVDLLSQVTGLASADRQTLTAYAADIPRKSRTQLNAAAKIMEACTLYALMKNTISLRRSNFIRNMDQYIEEHISEDLSVGELCRQFGVSKTKLYQSWSFYYGHSIAEHIRIKRIEAAKRLLKETDLTVTEIASAVGFSDYNYFCRTFKKAAGISAKKYRQQT